MEPVKKFKKTTPKRKAALLRQKKRLEKMTQNKELPKKKSLWGDALERIVRRYVSSTDSTPPSFEIDTPFTRIPSGPVTIASIPTPPIEDEW